VQKRREKGGKRRLRCEKRRCFDVSTSRLCQKGRFVELRRGVRS
jgi:hypothetical protein